jgi:hypothetical protein
VGLRGRPRFFESRTDKLSALVKAPWPSKDDENEGPTETEEDVINRYLTNRHQRSLFC